MPAPSAAEAMSILRDSSHFQWYVIPLLALVVYVYAVEIEKSNWSQVLGGLTFWGMDWINEWWNGLLFHFTQYAPAWGAPGKTAFLIAIGLNIEIAFFFAIGGVLACKSLPKDPRGKLFGLPNRLVCATLMSILCVAVEYLLNSAGALTWEWSWWNRGAPWLIFLLGYLPFFVAAFWVHDLKTTRQQATAVGVLYAFNFVAYALCMGILKWI